MRAKKRGSFGRPGDLAWVRAWDALTVETPVEEPKTRKAPKEPKTPRTPGYAATHGTGTKSDPTHRCGADTKSGPCIRPLNHPHGHMSAATRDAKVENAKAKKAAEKAARDAAKAAAEPQPEEPKAEETAA
jgi:hypothetical protein